MSSTSSQLPKAKKTKKDRKKLKKAQDEANAVYDSLSNGQIDILSTYSTEHILGMRLSNYDRNLLHIAVWFNVEVLIDKLCSNSAFKPLINDKDANGETPLHISVFCQNVEAYRKLLAAGANLEITNNKGESPLDTALDPAKWQNYQNQDQATGISPSIIKSDQIAKSEEIKNPEPRVQSPQQEQPQPVIIQQQPETKKNEDQNKPIENKNDKLVEKKTLEVQPMDSKEMPPSPNFGAVNKDIAKTSPKNIQPEIRTPIPNKIQEQKNENKITPFAEKEVQKIDEKKVSTEIKKSSTENKVTPFVEREVQKIDEKKNSTEIKKPLIDNKVTPLVEKEVQKIDDKKPLIDNKVTPIPQEKDIPIPKNDNKNSISQEKKSQDLKVTPILPEKDDLKDNKNTRISQEKGKQDLKIPTQNDSKKDPQIPLVLPQEKNQQDLKIPPQNDSKKDQTIPQEKIISTVPTHNQNKDTTKVPTPQPEKTVKDTSNPLNAVISPKTNGDTIPQPRKNTSQKGIVTPQENPIKKIESNNTPIPHSNPLNDSTPYSLVNHGTTSRETQPKKVDNIVKNPENSNSNLIETFAKPLNNTSIPSKNETTTSPTKRNTSQSRTNLNLNNEAKSNNSPKLVEKKKNDDSKKDLRESHIPDILDKTENKMPALNLQPTPIKPQQKRESSKETIRGPVTNSSSRLNDSSLPSLKKDTRTNSRGGSKTPFRTNAREILGSNNPASLTFETKSPTKVESKRDLSRNKDSSKSILASHLNLIDEKSPAKRENSSLMNKRPNMMSYKGSGANLQLDISRKLKDDYPNPKADRGYRVGGSKIDSSPLDSTSSPSLGFNDRRLSNIMHAHSKYTNDSSSLKLLEQRNRSVEKVDNNGVLFEYSNHSQANIRTKTEQNKDWDSMFDISMHTEGNDKSFSSPFRPGRMLYVNPVDNTYPKIKPISPEKKDRTLSPIRDKDPEYSFGKPLVPKQDFIFGRQKSPTGKREETSPSPLRKAELIYVTNSDYNFTTQGSDAPLNANRRFKRDTWKGGNFG